MFATLLCAGAVAALAASAAAGASMPIAPASGAPNSPVPGATGQVGGKIRLVLQHVGGSPPFALLDQRIVVRGIVTPYVGGQTVSVGFYRDGRQVQTQTVSVLAMSDGAGQFHVNFVSGYGGLVEARAAHSATAQQAAFSGRSPGVRYVSANVGPGARGQSVRLLQSEL